MILTLLAPVIAVVAVASVAGVLSLQRRRQTLLVGRTAPGPLPSGEAGPRLLYFTGPACTVCHTAQQPALDRLRTMLGALPLTTVDVSVTPALARRYRVMTLPTTIVLDPEGTVVALNAGFASAERLRDQLLPLLAAA